MSNDLGAGHRKSDSGVGAREHFGRDVRSLDKQPTSVYHGSECIPQCGYIGLRVQSKCLFRAMLSGFVGNCFRLDRGRFGSPLGCLRARAHLYVTVLSMHIDLEPRISWNDQEVRIDNTTWAPGEWRDPGQLLYNL